MSSSGDSPTSRQDNVDENQERKDENDGRRGNKRRISLRSMTRLERLSEEKLSLEEENQCLIAQLKASRKRERELIEALVDAQIRVDKLEEVHINNKQRIDAMLVDIESQSTTESDEMSNPDQAKKSPNKEELMKLRIQELEQELNQLKGEYGEVSSKVRSSAAMWKYIANQRDRLAVRDELAQCKADMEDLRDQLEQVQLSRKTAMRQAALANTQLIASQRAHAEQTAKLEERIGNLTSDVILLRKTGTREVVGEIQKVEMVESEEMQKAIQILMNEVGSLKYLSSVLQETCSALKGQLEEMSATEAELGKSRAEIRKLQRELAAVKAERKRKDKTDEIDDQQTTGKKHATENGQKLLWLRAENHRLHNMVDLLRMQLARASPAYRSKYNFITGV
ncbi:unnamed protein product [Calicophoron daubneyi]|uniref:Uncharacterized protein n=1 Tax=Calicophoron daubneyi TaxID=300641 RepID=A0AAV2T8A4_CALDB